MSFQQIDKVLTKKRADSDIGMWQWCMIDASTFTDWRTQPPSSETDMVGLATCKCSDGNNNESIPLRSSSGPSAPRQRGPRRLRRSWPRRQTWCWRCWAACWRRGKSSAHLCSRAVCEMAGTGSTLLALLLDRVRASTLSYWSKFLRFCRLAISP